MTPVAFDEQELWKRYTEASTSDAFLSYLRQSYNRYIELPLNIAVIGPPRVGKSSLIIAIIGKNDALFKSAKIEITGDMVLIESNDRQTNAKFTLLELHALEQQVSSLADYVRKIYLDTYDVVLVLSDTRFSEADAWLAERITSMQIKLLYVRVKCDEMIKNAMHDAGNTSAPDENEIISRAHADISQIINNASIPIFLTSSRNTEQFDLIRLREYLVNCFSSEKRTTWSRYVKASGEKHVFHEMRTIKKYAIAMVLVSTCGALIPYPGVSVILDLAIVTWLMIHCERRILLGGKTNIFYRKFHRAAGKVTRRITAVLGVGLITSGSAMLASHIVQSRQSVNVGESGQHILNAGYIYAMPLFFAARIIILKYLSKTVKVDALNKFHEVVGRNVVW